MIALNSTTFDFVTLRNFLSYGNATSTVTLNRPGTTLIQGEDLDNTTHGKTANGVGKTTLLNAICWGIYNKTISKFTVDELVNDINGKEMEVTVQWTNATGTKYRVHRYRKMKAPMGNGVKFYINDEDKTRVGPEMQQDIEEAIGMPFEIFVRMVIFSARHEPFLELPATSTTAVNQRDILEELFGLTELSVKAEKEKAKIKQTELDLKLKNATAAQAQSEIDRHEKRIESAKARVEDWYDQTEATIISLNAKLKKAKGVDIAEQQGLHDQRDAIDVRINEFTIKKRDLTRSLTTLKQTLTKSKSEAEHLADNKCPYCSQEYKGSDEKLKHLTEDCSLLQEEINKVQIDIDELARQLLQLADDRDAISDKITVNNIAELGKIQADADNIKARIAELSAEVNPHEEALKELQEQTFEDVDLTEVRRLEKLLEHQKLLHKMLTKSDSFVRKALLNQNLPYLNQQLRISLRELGMPHTVEFQPDMTTKIVRNGREIKFHQLSAGQSARINFALALAFTDVRQRLHGKVSICLFDEVLDSGLDSVGVQLAAKLIKKRAFDSQTSTFVVSHREEASSMFDRKITVQMHQGFSSIVDDALV